MLNSKGPESRISTNIVLVPFGHIQSFENVASSVTMQGAHGSASSLIAVDFSLPKMEVFLVVPSE